MFFANVTSNWTVQTDQSTASAANYKASDLQVAQCAPSSESAAFQMAHKMGLVNLNPTTKSVYNKLTYTYNKNDGTYTQSTSGSATITASNDFTGNKPYVLDSQYWHIVKATGASTCTAMSFTCNANQKNYWSAKSSGTDVGYGKYKTIDIQSDRTAANFEATFSYVGKCQTITLPWYDNYKLEVYGAQGGYGGGKGGYTAGTANLSGTLYVYVGGQGLGDGTHVARAGGYNGGGSTTLNADGNVRNASGGGATHIAKVSGLLSALSSNSNRANILVVAGGGGGKGGNVAVMYCNGGNGAGGNINGTNGQQYAEGSYYRSTGLGGTTSAGGSYSSNLPSTYLGSAGSFGQGGSSTSAGGGGGYFGGGGCCYSAGGGSGFLNTNYVTQTSATTGTRAGNGYAQITSQ